MNISPKPLTVAGHIFAVILLVLISLGRCLSYEHFFILAIQINCSYLYTQGQNYVSLLFMSSYDSERFDEYNSQEFEIIRTV